MKSKCRYTASMKRAEKKKGSQKRAFTLVEIMIVVMILALLTAIAIPNVLKARMSANDVMAQAALKTIGKAMEQFWLNNDSYPSSTNNLVTITPPYLNKDYFTGTYSGFTFSSTLTASSYTIVATPVSLGQTGSTTFSIATGGVMQGN